MNENTSVAPAGGFYGKPAVDIGNGALDGSLYGYIHTGQWLLLCGRKYLPGYGCLGAQVTWRYNNQVIFHNGVGKACCGQQLVQHAAKRLVFGVHRYFSCRDRQTHRYKKTSIRFGLYSMKRLAKRYIVKIDRKILRMRRTCHCNTKRNEP